MARRQRKRVPPAIIPGPSDQSATPQPTAAVPLDARQLTIVVPLAWETDGSETLPPGRRFFSLGVPPPQPWQDQADTPWPLKVLEEQEPPITAGGESPPNLPPSDGDTAGASQPDLSATFAGGGAFSADAKGVRPSNPMLAFCPRAPSSGPPPIGSSCVAGRLIFCRSRPSQRTAGSH
jgi:hypothetical protein